MAEPVTSLDWQPPVSPPRSPLLVECERIFDLPEPVRDRVAAKIPAKKLRRFIDEAKARVAKLDSNAKELNARVAFLRAVAPLTDHIKEAWMNRKEFFDTAVMPDAMPDEIDLVIRREGDDDRGLSIEAFEQISYQFHDFVLARMLAQWQRAKRPPRGLRARVTIEWDDDQPSNAALETTGTPWYAYDDQAADVEPLTLDGIHRFTQFLDNRKENNDDSNSDQTA